MSTTNASPRSADPRVLIDDLSRRLRQDGSVTSAEMNEVKALLTPEQLKRIQAKQQWERCSFLGVLADWPSLFYPAEAVQDGGDAS